LGVNFSSTEKNIAECIIVSLGQRVEMVVQDDELVMKA